MDWYLDPSDADAGQALRQEISAYLARHAAPGEDVWAAELAVSELVGNAVRHADGPVWVSIDWSGPQPLLDVHDLGAAFDLHATLPQDDMSESGRGLFLVSHVTEQLSRAAKRAGGNRVTARLPLQRAPERSFDPPRRSANPLPALEEAQPEGGFGREAFLRALVVQLAHAVELTHGPEAAEAAVAQVGADVGTRMEEEYRLAKGLVDRLTPAEMADCYVRLKAAIDGDFYIVEVTEDRIVLGNRRCPFGMAVRTAPGLCRMTSSVFGGIAARNAGQAAVVLEERIAVGDPECRVVVALKPDESTAQTAHHYGGEAALNGA